MSRPAIALTCMCDQCSGREVQVPSPRWRSLNRLPSPTRERVIHQAVNRGTGVIYTRILWVISGLCLTWSMALAAVAVLGGQ